MRLPKVPRRLLLMGAAACVVVLTSVFAFAAPASAGSMASCASSPSNNNCNNVAIHPGDACYNSSVSVTSITDWDPLNIGWGFKTELMWSGSCQVNWTRTTVTSSGPVPETISNKIRRMAGPDGSYLMFHAGWVTEYTWAWTEIDSPMVWAPHEAAQGCVSTQMNDQLDCTAAF